METLEPIVYNPEKPDEAIFRLNDLRRRTVQGEDFPEELYLNALDVLRQMRTDKMSSTGKSKKTVTAASDADIMKIFGNTNAEKKPE